MEKPMIFVFTGTSGSGRKTIAHRIGHEFELTHVVSCTTRPPQDQEMLDKDYHYLTMEQFAEAERNGEFVQIADIDKQRYGIRKRDLEAAMDDGSNIYLILNREGASAIKQLYGDRVIRLFLYVDKLTVRERLEAKGRSFDVIEQYLDHYTEEVTYRRMCEHVFENVELTRTLDLINPVVKGYLL